MSSSDAELVARTAEGDQRAFGQLVERHQAAVCGVAYSVVGDFSQSQDVAQEAFVAAWRQLDQLREPVKFKPWICAIARNLALMLVRRKREIRPLDQNAPLASRDLSHEEQLARREEEALVWRALRGLPEKYREPLVLYYLEEQSVARVAASLDLSPDATKQRLARGREMLREEVATTIERTLARNAPSKAFTLAILGALGGMGAGSAGAATVAAAGKSAGPLAVKGLAAASASAWIGVLGGLFGAGLGIWFGDRSMRYPRERSAFRSSLIGFAIIAAVFMLPLAAMLAGWWNPINRLGGPRYALALVTWQLAFFAALGLWTWRLVRRLKRIAGEEIDKGTISVPLQVLSQWQGRRWTSSCRFLSLPLVDIQFADPANVSQYDVWRTSRPMARGWIALGDRACGLIALGQVAIGGVALGGVSCGAIAVGGLGVGLVSLSGLAVGLVSMGGLALGGFSFGGVALGWSAFGGAAFAWHAAKGGLAVARDFALGGLAIAAHANDPGARAHFEDSTLFQAADRAVQVIAPVSHYWAYPLVLAACILALVGLTTRIAYQRKAQ